MNRNRYPVSVMCQFFQVSRSGYYDYVKRLDQPEHDAELAEIIREQQENVISLTVIAVCGSG